MRSNTPLHRLLGRDPGRITDELLTDAVAAALAETDDLDWKSDAPPSSHIADGDFPKDVASMANTGGGVIVYGVTEKGKKATGRVDIGELTEMHARALNATAYSAIRPPVLGLSIYEVGKVPNRAIVVEVPASTEGPHMVFKNQFFGVPFRNGADTAWMTERQIEAAYRARLEERRRAAEALTDLYDEAVANWSWDESNRAVLVAVAHPRLPLAGAQRVEKTQASELFIDGYSLACGLAGEGIHPLDSVDKYNPRPGLRRWLVPINPNQGMRWRAATAAVHNDGSVTLTATVGGHRKSAEGSHQATEMEATGIETAVADFAALVRVVAIKHGLGEYDVRVGIESVEDGEPLKIFTVDSHGTLYTDISIPLFRYSPVLSTLVADASDASYQRQVYGLAEDCVNQGGITVLRKVKLPPEDEE